MENLYTQREDSLKRDDITVFALGKPAHKGK